MALFETVESSIFREKPVKHEHAPKTINSPSKKAAKVKVPVPLPKPAGKAFGNGYLESKFSVLKRRFR